MKNEFPIFFLVLLLNVKICIFFCEFLMNFCPDFAPNSRKSDVCRFPINFAKTNENIAENSWICENYPIFFNIIHSCPYLVPNESWRRPNQQKGPEPYIDAFLLYLHVSCRHVSFQLKGQPCCQLRKTKAKPLPLLCGRYPSSFLCISSHFSAPVFWHPNMKHSHARLYPYTRNT